jgi:hypothetical protein
MPDRGSDLLRNRLGINLEGFKHRLAPGFC